MKIKKRIVSLFSVIIVCIPFIFMFPFTASADTYNPPKNVDISGAAPISFRDLVTYLAVNHKCEESLYNNVSSPNIVYRVLIDSEYQYFKFNYDTDYLGLILFSIFDASLFGNHSSSCFSLDDKVYFYGYYSQSEKEVFLVYSKSYIYINTTNRKYFESDSEIAFIRKKPNSNEFINSSLNKGRYNTSDQFYYISNPTSYCDVRVDNPYYTFRRLDYFVNGCCLEGYPNFIENPDMTGCYNVSDFMDKPLSEQIEVTLTPEFGIGMDIYFSHSN